MLYLTHEKIFDSTRLARSLRANAKKTADGKRERKSEGGFRMLSLKIILFALAVISFIAMLVTSDKEELIPVWLIVSIGSLVLGIMLCLKMYFAMKITMGVAGALLLIIGIYDCNDYESGVGIFSIICAAVFFIALFTKAFGLLYPQNYMAELPSESVSDDNSSTVYQGRIGPTDEPVTRERNEVWLFMNEN